MATRKQRRRDGGTGDHIAKAAASMQAGAHQLMCPSTCETSGG